MISLNDYFKKIYCINLERRSDRWKECLDEFDNHNLIVDRYNAIDGNGLTSKTNLSNGQMGTVYSHLGILQNAKECNLSDILILEDDVQFHRDFNSLFNAWQSEIPEDWDMIFFGGNHALNNPWSPGKLTQVTEHVYKVTHCLSLHCYAVKNTIYDKLISVLSEMDRTADEAFARIQEDINCYIIRPHLAWQRPSFSDLREMFVDMPFLYDDKSMFEGRLFGREAIERDDVYDKLAPHEKVIFEKQKREHNY